MKFIKYIYSKINKAAAVLALVIFAFAAISWHTPTDPLMNTKWKGTVYVPNEYEGTFEFRNDSLMLTVADRVIETSYYSTKGDTLFMKKLSGGSPCGQETGSYTFTINNNTLKLAKVDDSCIERGEAYSPNGYKRINY